jgi:hypothetical protein
MEDEIDRDEWNREWSVMPIRDSPNPEQIDVSAIFGLNAGRVTSMSASLVPARYLERLYFSVF